MCKHRWSEIGPRPDEILARGAVHLGMEACVAAPDRELTGGEVTPELQPWGGGLSAGRERGSDGSLGGPGGLSSWTVFWPVGGSESIPHGKGAREGEVSPRDVCFQREPRRPGVCDLGSAGG